ncbi:hypothetical protein [uncultured Draconibacterium sp.]|uniref:hypothetical protein n=1 Tax=uncultured Draconibacterium sp. TaxID=1573823 RepID=UPI0029C98EFB|nr:hypothetical protein [uncultured Draconibacterium sp.]
MKSEIEIKLNQIANIWNHFIWEYKFCSRKIKFTDDVKTNYFGDILGYFQDTLDIIFSQSKGSDFIDKFSVTISILQAIYVQQDFVQEMLEIFKTGIEKGNLKQNQNYSINREIRNELIGHPIRKQSGKLISSTLFSYHAKEGEIQYLRYHKDKKFEYEVKTFKISEIQKRHHDFLKEYFDVIIEKLKEILDDYLLGIDKLENVIKGNDFETLLKLVELYSEAIFKSDYAYDKSSLIKIYNKRKEHIRYQSFIDRFCNDLEGSIIETRKYIKSIFERQHQKIEVQNSLPKIEFVFKDFSIEDVKEIRKQQEKSYHYEIGKLATKRNWEDFNFFGGILTSKCKENKLVISELKHMEENIYDEIEYYSSLRLIMKELKEE